MGHIKVFSILGIVGIAGVLLATAAAAQNSGSVAGAPTAPSEVTDNQSGRLEEIIVTAQKRSERINDVPMSITAVTADELQSRGISNVADLVKVVPGFQYTNTYYGAPVFTIRGIGFYDNSVAARPTVSAYVDEIPVPFSALTQGVALDLEHVEVLKGPQGTLFGSNSTGGALNFIAAKPTRDFQYGGDVTVGRFAQGDTSAFVSGPVSDTIAVRVALKQEFGGDWQQSVTRDDTLGQRDKTFGRVLVDFHPTDRLRFMLSLNGFRDGSDTQAAQYIATTQLVPGGPLPPN